MRHIGIKFQNGVTQEERSSILSSDTALGPGAVWRYVDEGENIALVGLRWFLSADDILAALDRLYALEEVVYATPVIWELNPVFEHLTTDEFYISFRTPVPLEELEALNAQHHVEVVSIRDYSAIDVMGYYWRVTKASGINALFMSNLYFE